MKLDLTDIPKTGFSVGPSIKGPIERLSEAANWLVGKTLDNGHKILEVAYPERGGALARNFRRVEFQTPEGDVYRKDLSKEAISSLCSIMGYKEYTSRFQTLKSPIEKGQHVFESKLQREKANITGPVKKLRKDLAYYKAKAEILNPGGEIDEVQVKWEGTTMNLPRVYADFGLKMKKSKNSYLKGLFTDFEVLHKGQNVKSTILETPFEEIHKGLKFSGEEKSYVLIKEQGKDPILKYMTDDELKYWASLEGKAQAKRIKTRILTDPAKILSELGVYKEPYTEAFE